MPPGLLLVGHGTRNAAGLAEFLETANLIGQRLNDAPVENALRGVPVQHCFLELAEPTIAAGLAKLVEQGVRQVVAVPLLLFAAGHARRDIPSAIDEAAQALANLDVSLASPFGCQAEILELSDQRFGEACRDLSDLDLRETALILAGRGSHDAQATAEMHRFTQLRSQHSSLGKAATCFLAMAEPRLQDVLAESAAAGWRRIVVQPHLLFQGELLEQLQVQTAAARQRWPDREWLVTPHLGPAPLLVEAILSRFHEQIAAIGIREMNDPTCFRVEANS